MKTDCEKSIVKLKLWRKNNCCTRVIVYLLSLLISYHNLTWFNCRGQFPIELSEQMSVFSGNYFCFTSISQFFPRAINLCCCLYFGMIRLDFKTNPQLASSFLEASFTSAMTSFFLISGTNFLFSATQAEPSPDANGRKSTRGRASIQMF
jgi:hypothetical protein